MDVTIINGKKTVKNVNNRYAIICDHHACFFIQILGYFCCVIYLLRYLDFKHFLFNTVSPSIRFMRFLNRNAYIMCAMKGSNFCVSAKDAFNLLMRNIVRVVVLNGIVNFLLFIGKLVIVVGVGTLSYFFFRYHSYIT